jgi:hypothetical protein
LTTVGLDYQVIHTPYRPRNPFAQTIALNVRVPLGNYRVSAASFVTPDGRVPIWIHDLGLQAPNADTEVEVDPLSRVRRYRQVWWWTNPASRWTERRSTLVDRRCSPTRVVFFVRRSSSRAATLRVLLDEFLATGRFEVVSASAL